MSQLPVTEADLHAYADGLLPEARLTEIEAHLASEPEVAERVEAWRVQNRALHAKFDAVLAEPLPDHLHAAARRVPRRPVLRYAAAIAWIALGGVSGWNLHSFSTGRPAETMAFVRQAAIAHAVYSPEVRHPVEVGADQETHLVAWLSKRLGASLKVPQLNAIGYHLVGGRLLPGNQGPAAQFMFQDATGQRLTLYVRTAASGAADTAFRFAQERGVSVFYWLDGRFGYALSGEVERAKLLRVAKAVYQQLNP